MHNEATLPLATVYAFLVVLARVSGAVIFVPIPGISSSPEPVRAVLGLSLTMALFPVWPAIPVLPDAGLLVGWLISEAALGITIGLLVGFLSEGFAVFGQMVGLNSGHSFASTIDPNSQADSGVFVVLSQSISGLLFFSLGLHREVVRVFARSLQTQPPGSFTLSSTTADLVIRMGSTIFSTGLRLAFPVIALLVMMDLSLALLGRISAQLPLFSLAFPVKIMAALALLSLIATTYPRVYQDYAERLFEVLPALSGR